MAFNIYIDGEAGTTGLQIRKRLENRSDLSMISIDPALRKDTAARKEAINSADVVILCLPDAAAKEAVSLIERDGVRVIDASTAHRVAQGWTYGFAEMGLGQRRAIAQSKRVANPGCFATAAIALLRPLTQSGLLPGDFPVTINAISGYSGGGKELIGEFEDENASKGVQDVFRIYGLPLAHKHLPEIQAYSELTHAPVFAPAVGRYAQGMLLEVPLPLWAVKGTPTPTQLHEALVTFYEGAHFVQVATAEEIQRLQEVRLTPRGHVEALDPESLNNTNTMKLFVFGSENGQHARLVALLDNLGKGASGAAVQNLNIMLGLDEAIGL